MQGRIIPVILSGGAGTRLWPLSTAEMPKQMHALFGDRTMLQEAALRVSDESLFLSPMVVASASHAKEIDAQLADVSSTRAKLLLEPCGRNTGPAIALAAIEATADDLLLVLPSDHLITDLAAFYRAVRIGAAAAEEGWLVTFGVEAREPETGYGYIRRGRELAEDLFEVERFVEKPDLETARAWLSEGGYYWNAGIFLFKAGAYLEALAEHAPETLSGVQRAMTGANRGGMRVEPEPTAFASVSPRSIDHLVMEHAARVAVVPVEMGWSDVGSWDAIWKANAKDEDENATSGAVTAIDTHRCLLRSDGPGLFTVGVEDLIVVATKDAVLIIGRGESQRVRETVEVLEGGPGASPS